jgi:hypothetical protein
MVELSSALAAGVALDFARDPARPILRYPQSAESIVHALLDEARRPELRRVLSLAAAYRRALIQADPEAERLAGDLDPALAEAVRRTLPGDASAPVTHRDAFYRNEFIRARTIAISGNTRHHASPAPIRHPWIDLDPATLREVLGPDVDDPHALACLRFDVLAAVREIEEQIATGKITPVVRLVRGRALALWLGMEQLARLMVAWDARMRRRA